MNVILILFFFLWLCDVEEKRSKEKDSERDTEREMKI